MLTLLTVVLSAYIRLADVGIGCDGWPDCYAQLNPGAEQKGVTVLTEDGRDMAHYGARVAHRYIASVLGLFILGITIAAFRQSTGRATSITVPLAILGITVFLSLLGYYTPTRSNPLITMGNLIGGMSLLALLWWLMQREAERGVVVAGGLSVRPLAWGALALVTLQILLGGWSSANFASANCDGLIQCQGAPLGVNDALQVFSPLRDVTLDDSGKVVREDSLGLLSLTHRLFALFTAAYLAWMVRRLRPRTELKGTLVCLSVCSISQIAIGISAIWFAMPLWLTTAHNGLAALLLLACVNLLHLFCPAKASPPPR